MDFNQPQFLYELKTRKDYINSVLDEYLKEVDAFPPLIHQAMHYAVFNGGKRIRPIMLMEGAILAGSHRDRVLPSACALEMIHSYSLVHDDLPAMDDDDFRRGKPTCHKVFGEANAILTGDALLTRAFELLAQNAKVPGIEAERVLRVIEEVARAAGSLGMIGGQVVDLAYEGANIGYDKLKTMHSLKTGALFRCALRGGAILGGMQEEGVQALDDYAMNFGLAFQITDDILDVKGDESTLGKPVGSDEKNRKTTYPALFGIEGASTMAGESVKACLESLRHFGESADFLRQLASYLLLRDS